MGEIMNYKEYVDYANRLKLAHEKIEDITKRDRN